MAKIQPSSVAHQPALGIGHPRRPFDRDRHRPSHHQRQRQEQPGVAKIEAGHHPPGAKDAKRQAAVLEAQAEQPGGPGATQEGTHQQDD